MTELAFDRGVLRLVGQVDPAGPGVLDHVAGEGDPRTPVHLDRGGDTVGVRVAGSHITPAWLST